MKIVTLTKSLRLKTLFSLICSTKKQVIFGIFAIAAGFFSFFLPETKGKNLPTTVEEAENFYKGISMLFNIFYLFNIKFSTFNKNSYHLCIAIN